MSDNPELLKAMKRAAPGFYTERDGGDWYIVVPGHGSRLGEDFTKRDDARAATIWIAGGAIPSEMPKGWAITGATRLSFDLDCRQGYRATLWRQDVEQLFPAALASLDRLAAEAKKDH